MWRYPGAESCLANTRQQEAQGWTRKWNRPITAIKSAYNLATWLINCSLWRMGPATWAWMSWFFLDFLPNVNLSVNNSRFMSWWLDTDNKDVICSIVPYLFRGPRMWLLRSKEFNQFSKKNWFLSLFHDFLTLMYWISISKSAEGDRKNWRPQINGCFETQFVDLRIWFCNSLSALQSSAVAASVFGTLSQFRDSKEVTLDQGRVIFYKSTVSNNAYILSKDITSVWSTPTHEPGGRTFYKVWPSRREKCLQNKLCPSPGVMETVYFALK